MQCIPDNTSAADEAKLLSVTEKKEKKRVADTKSVRFECFSKTAVKWTVAATAVLLLCSGGVAYAAKLGILQFTKVGDKENHGFSLTTEIERISAEDLLIQWCEQF